MILGHFVCSLLLVTVVHCGSLVDKILEDMEFVAVNIGKIREDRDVASVFELADVAVRDLHRTYGIDIYDDDDIFVLHKELVQFHSLEKEKQDEIISGTPSNFKAISRLLKELRKIEKKELAKLKDDDKEMMKDQELFINYAIRGKPLAMIVRNNLGSTVYMKMTPEERKKVTAEKSDRLMKLWTGDEQVMLEEYAKNLGIDPEAFARGEIDMNGNKIEKNEL
ncbi:hypothetical protein PENTCL1PPCAC_5956 [Pristionchus entomophagus]|uniref:Uncharacterized protein n=1 Tax=Pristionchus entomophagus TaxID=358040 RepID=A0AAV5SWA4_9BILA|nr:hypothetical protein PENTCL1PPCAC_5956 [Pristionchus entomophagus]